jgi:hypothetical protein
MKPTTTIVLLTLLALPASAQDARTFHDAAGPNGVTTFHDRLTRGVDGYQQLRQPERWSRG